MRACLRSLAADQAIKAVVLAVGSFVAVVSYSHIYDLAGAAVPGGSVRPPTKERGPSMPSRGA
jgi:hypothetical protein